MLFKFYCFIYAYCCVVNIRFYYHLRNDIASCFQKKVLLALEDAGVFTSGGLVKEKVGIWVDSTLIKKYIYGLIVLYNFSESQFLFLFF